MTDETNEDLPQADPDPTPAPPRTRWRDRVVGFRGVLAVALASLILGGVGGAAIGVVASGGDDHGRQGPAQVDFRDGDRQPHGVPGMPGAGQLPPVTPPEGEVEPDAAPSTSSDTESGTNS